MSKIEPTSTSKRSNSEILSDLVTASYDLEQTIILSSKLIKYQPRSKNQPHTPSHLFKPSFTNNSSFTNTYANAKLPSLTQILKYSHLLSTTTSAPPSWLSSQPIIGFHPPTPVTAEFRIGILGREERLGLRVRDVKVESGDDDDDDGSGYRNMPNDLSERSDDKSKKRKAATSPQPPPPPAVIKHPIQQQPPKNWRPGDVINISKADVLALLNNNGTASSANIAKVNGSVDAKVENKSVTSNGSGSSSSSNSSVGVVSGVNFVGGVKKGGVNGFGGGGGGMNLDSSSSDSSSEDDDDDE